MKKVLLALCMVVFISSTAVAAEMPHELESELPKQVREIVGDTDIGTAQGLDSIFKQGIEGVKGQLGGALAQGIKLLVAAGLCGIAASAAKAGQLPMSEKLVECGTICIIIILCAGDTKSILVDSRQSIEEIGVFSKILLPLFSTWAAAAGKPLAAISIAGGAMVYTNVICYIALNFIFPVIMAYIMMVGVQGFSGDKLLEGLSRSIKAAIFWAVKLCLGGITLYISLTGAVAAGGDTLAARGVKAAVSGVIPVVGATVASVTETVLAGAAMTRNTIGVAGICAVLAIALMPFVRLLAYMLVFRCVSYVVSALSTSGVAQCVEGVSDAYAMALGLLASACGGVIMAITMGISLFGGL